MSCYCHLYTEAGGVANGGVKTSRCVGRKCREADGCVIGPGSAGRGAGERPEPEGRIAVQIGGRDKVTVHVDNHIRGRRTKVKHADPAHGRSRWNNRRIGHDLTLRIVQG
jgi:hypothetical protein